LKHFRQESKDHQGHRECRDQKDLKENQGHRECRDQKGLKENQGHRECRDQKGLKENQGYRDQREVLVHLIMIVDGFRLDSKVTQLGLCLA